MLSSSRHWLTLLLICCALLLTDTILVSKTEAQQKDPFPDGPGKNTFLQNCSTCHSPDNVFGKPRNADAWTSTLNKMMQYGADGSQDDFAAILNYLATNFGPPPDKINVNKISVVELRNWLTFSQKQAEDFVAYRKERGGFKSLDDLKKIPGIDPKIIDDKKEVLAF